LILSAAGLGVYAQGPYPEGHYVQGPYTQGPAPSFPGYQAPAWEPSDSVERRGHPDFRRLPPVEPLPPGPGPQYVYPDFRRLPPAEPDAGPQLQAAAAEEFLPTVQPEPKPQPPELEPNEKLWEGSFELGLDGSEGNTRTFNVQFGMDVKRKTDCDVLSLDLDYRKKTAAYLETANRALLDWRYEQLYDDSPWTTFVHGTVDYDEFQAFDVRVAADVGLGFQLIDWERTTLAVRFSGGFSHEIGGPDDAYVPELNYGLDFEHRISDRQKLAAQANYIPDVTEFSDFRLKTEASWELLIDKEMNLSLKLSVLDRYDSTPHGLRPNDLDYSAMLLWKF